MKAKDLMRNNWDAKVFCFFYAVRSFFFPLKLTEFHQKITGMDFTGAVSSLLSCPGRETKTH